MDINETGQEVGWAFVEVFLGHAVPWYDGRLRDLGLLSTSHSEAQALAERKMRALSALPNAIGGAEALFWPFRGPADLKGREFCFTWSTSATHPWLGSGTADDIGDGEVSVDGSGVLGLG